MLLLLLVLCSVASTQKLNKDVTFSSPCAESADDRLTIVGVGDVLLHGPLQQVAVKAKSFIPLWQDVLPVLQQGDLFYANQEGPTAAGILASGKSIKDPGFAFDNLVYSGYPQFNYHPSLVDDLVASKVDVVSAANNHALDRRSVGADKTIEVQEAAGLKHTGVRHSNTGPNGSFHTIVEKKGWRIGFIACSFSTNGMPDKLHQVLMCFEDRDLVLSIVRELAARPDLDAVIATPHWGNEYQDDPQPKEIALAHMLVDAGATSVIATHPHVVQPWEKYVTRDGREAVIAYSTGNFVSGQTTWKKQLSLAVFIGLSRKRGSKAVVHGVNWHGMTMLSSPTYKLISLPRTPAYKMQWDHLTKMLGAERLLEKDEPLNTCGPNKPSAPVAPVNSAPRVPVRQQQ